jgi:plastocyanin
MAMILTKAGSVKKITATLAVTFFLVVGIVLATPIVVGKSYAQENTSPTLSGTTFPPPIFYQLRNQPSYVITIPFNSQGKPPFEPADVSIPTGMTIMWFNDDNGQHSVTTMSNSTYSPPQTLKSGPIPTNGGSFLHTFSKAGTYDYYDQFNPSIHGRIVVATGMEAGKNMNMLVGGDGLPFNPGEAKRFVLTIVPKTVKIPPTIALTYNVTLLNSTGKSIYSHKYDTADGLLDLELVPTHKSLSKNATMDFVTWGPDFIGQEAIRSTGTFHIKGPILVDNSLYSIRVAIVANSNSLLSPPIEDTFALPPNAAATR